MSSYSSSSISVWWSWLFATQMVQMAQMAQSQRPTSVTMTSALVADHSIIPSSGRPLQLQRSDLHGLPIDIDGDGHTDLIQSDNGKNIAEFRTIPPVKMCLNHTRRLQHTTSFCAADIPCPTNTRVVWPSVIGMFICSCVCARQVVIVQ